MVGVSSNDTRAEQSIGEATFFLLFFTSGVLRERKKKGKGTIREREGIDRGEKGKQTWKRERKERAFLSIHTQIVLKVFLLKTCPKIHLNLFF